ncbi:MAG TPA: C25 family cysteine peptidase [bacterium]|nr:C25 family cysteine peptidase [bacterium]
MIDKRMKKFTTCLILLTGLIAAGSISAGFPDSQREALWRNLPGAGDAVSFQILENHVEEAITFECRLMTDDPAMLPGRGVLVRISDTRRPDVVLEPVVERRIKLDTLDAVDRALVQAGRQGLPLQRTGVYPAEALVAGEPMIMRSIRVMPLRINAVRVDMDARELIVLEEARIHVFMGMEDTRNVLDYAPPITRTFDRYYRSVVLNYEPETRRLDQDPETYLVFLPDEYESRMQGWFAWKEAEGFEIDVLRKSELPSWPSPADLRNALLARYQGPNPPTFVLFIGDEYSTPIMLTYDPTHPGDYADDLYYSLLAGDDLLPEFFLGRLPAEDAGEVTIMINKIMRYELNPPVDSPEFWARSLMSASSLEPTQITTKEQTRERLELYCGHTNVLTYYDNWSEAMIDALMDDIDTGVCIINYRGEGWRSGWNPEHEYWFNLDDVYQLRNSNRVPYITSIGCGVSLFNTDSDCWSEAWMSHGSATISMGAVAVLGPTWNTHTTYNNWMDRGLYRGYCLWDVNRSGPMMDYGKAYVIEQFPDPQHNVYVDQHCRTYLLFGTPDMWVRMSMPQYVAAGLAYANNGMERYLSVRDTGGGIVANAQVSWEANGVRHVDITDEYGGVLITETTIPDDHLRFVITGKNLIPFQDDIPWTPAGNTGNLIITEIKPDIATTGTTGDMVEIYNAGTSPVDLNGWILSDLDGYDTPFVDVSAVLQPEQLAVIEFVGPSAVEEIIVQPYGLEIKSREVPDFSSLEDVAVLRDPDGCPVDSLAWHDNSGTASTNLAWDLTYLAGPESPFTMLDGGWWDAPDVVLPEEYETYAIDWSPFAGMGGDGSIQRATVSFPDGTADWSISLQTSFGQYTHSDARSVDTVHGAIRVE